MTLRRLKELLAVAKQKLKTLTIGSGGLQGGITDSAPQNTSTIAAAPLPTGFTVWHNFFGSDVPLPSPFTPASRPIFMCNGESVFSYDEENDPHKCGIITPANTNPVNDYDALRVDVERAAALARGLGLPIVFDIEGGELVTEASETSSTLRQFNAGIRADMCRWARARGARAAQYYCGTDPGGARAYVGNFYQIANPVVPPASYASLQAMIDALGDGPALTALRSDITAPASGGEWRSRFQMNIDQAPIFKAADFIVPEYYPASTVQNVDYTRAVLHERASFLSQFEKPIYFITRPTYADTEGLLPGVRWRDIIDHIWEMSQYPGSWVKGYIIWQRTTPPTTWPFSIAHEWYLEQLDFESDHGLGV